MQLPKTIQVAVGFTVIGNYRPERNGAMYSLYDDKGDGLVPITNSNDVKVNYFRVDDSTDQDNDDNKFLESPADPTKYVDVKQSDEEKQLAEDAMKKQGVPVLTEKKDDKGNVTYEAPAGSAFVVPPDPEVEELRKTDEANRTAADQEAAARSNPTTGDTNNANAAAAAASGDSPVPHTPP